MFHYNQGLIKAQDKILLDEDDTLLRLHEILKFGFSIRQFYVNCKILFFLIFGKCKACSPGF